MNNHKPSFRIAISALFGCVLFSSFLFSCKNFLNASNVSDEIKEVIAYNNAKAVNVSIECKEEMGTIFPQQSYQAKVGYAFEVQFIPNTENFLIKNPDLILHAISRIDRTQSRSENVEFKVTEQSFEDKKAGLYRIAVKVTKYADDILVLPDCTQLPKIQEIYPPYVPGGYDQDTTIRITFNKAMNPESFGAFDCVTILKGIDDVKDKYSTPYFTNENTVLNIPTKKGTNILGPESINVADITISIDITNIMDSEGFQFSQPLSYTYRINKNVDSAKPVITSFELKSTQDITSPLYKTLTNKKYENWTDTETGSFKYGDFSQNHVSDSVCFELTGYDNQSGVNAVKVTETYYKDVNGTSTSETQVSDSFGSGQFIYNSTDSTNNEIYTLSYKYKLRMPNDGIIKLDFQLLDNANNESDVKTYYVIKDSYIEANNCSFFENQDYYYYESVSENVGIDGIELVRYVVNGIDNVVFTPVDTAKDKYFKNYTTNYLLYITWGYSEDSINNSASEENGKYVFSHDPKRITYIRINWSDEVGNEKSFIKILLPQPYGLSYEKTDDNKKLYQLIGSNKGTYKEFVNSIGNSDFLYLYVFQKENGDLRVSLPSYSGLNLSGNNETYKVWIASVIKNNNLYWYSALSDEYCTVTFNASGNISNIGIVTPTSNVIRTEAEYEPYMKDYINVYTEPVHNSGCYKVTLDNYIAEDLDPTTDVKYTFKCSSIVNGKPVYSIFYEPTFYLKSNQTYSLYVEALDSNGVLYNPPWSYFYLNPDENPDVEESQDLELTGDLLPPEKTSIGHAVSWDTADYWIDSAPKDNDGGSGMYANADGKGELTYYFIPSSSNSNQYGEEYTLDEVKAYTPRKHIYDLSDQKIRIPLDGIEDGLYTICIVSRDKNENYSISCGPAYRRIIDRHINWSIQGDSSDQTLKIKIIKGNDNDYSDGYIYINGAWDIQTRSNGNIYSKWWKLSTYSGKWIKMDCYVSDNTYDAINDGWLYYEYFYFDYEYYKAIGTPLVYEKTNFIEGAAGLQFFTDAPVFVHTLYSEKKLTETNEGEDLCIWELRGHETGVVFKDDDFTYNKSQYNSIPAGSYYITIAHFADGTVAASEIKKK